MNCLYRLIGHQPEDFNRVKVLHVPGQLEAVRIKELNPHKVQPI